MANHLLRMMVYRLSPLLLILFYAATVLAAEPAQESDEFIQLKRNAEGELISLDTAVVSYSNDQPSPIQVDLIAAVHVGEKSYYQRLNQLFRDYDVVLYELVAPSDHKQAFAERKKSSSVLSSMQMGITDLLGLSFQLDEVDYGAQNFVHADLSPSEFLANMKDRGETFSGMLMRVLAASMVSAQSPESKSNSMQLMFLMMKGDSPNRKVRLRRILAAEFQGVDMLLKIVNGDNGSTLVAGRNDKALEVLKREMAQGQKSFAVFYGGAHMSDFHLKLKQDFGLTKGKTRWLEAWNLRLK